MDAPARERSQRMAELLSTDKARTHSREIVDYRSISGEVAGEVKKGIPTEIGIPLFYLAPAGFESATIGGMNYGL